MPSILNASTASGGGIIASGDSSGILQLQTGGTTAVTVSASQVVTFAQAPVLPSGSIPQAALASNVAGNGPAFNVHLSTSQTISSSNTPTKVTFNSKVFDTNNNFDATTNYRFQPTVAGYYQVTASLVLIGSPATWFLVQLYKNGSFYTYLADLRYGSSSNETGGGGSELVYMNGSTDYLEIYAVINGTAPLSVFDNNGGYSRFSGFLARSA